MGIRNFFRLLRHGVPPRPSVRHQGHDLADTVRDATGWAGAGGVHGGGRAAGDAVYKHIAKTNPTTREP